MHREREDTERVFIRISLHLACPTWMRPIIHQKAAEKEVVEKREKMGLFPFFRAPRWARQQIQITERDGGKRNWCAAREHRKKDGRTEKERASAKSLLPFVIIITSSYEWPHCSSFGGSSFYLILLREKVWCEWQGQMVSRPKADGEKLRYLSFPKEPTRPRIVSDYMVGNCLIGRSSVWTIGFHHDADSQGQANPLIFRTLHQFFNIWGTSLQFSSSNIFPFGTDNFFGSFIILGRSLYVSRFLFFLKGPLTPSVTGHIEGPCKNRGRKESERENERSEAATEAPKKQ